MPTSTIIREDILKKLKNARDQRRVRIVTGIRRCGKKTLLHQYQDWLRSLGVPQERIIEIDFEDPTGFSDQDSALPDKDRLDALSAKGKAYLFLYEIQNLKDFESTIASFLENENLDIYGTSSSASIRSTLSSTHLADQCLELPLLPLSLAEFSAQRRLDPEEAWPNYPIDSGFPALAFIPDSSGRKNALQDIYYSILVSEAVNKNNIANLKLFSRMVAKLIRLVGSPVNASSLAASLREAGLETTRQTIQSYLNAACDSFLFYEVRRFDIRNNRPLSQNSKYYLCDPGFRQLFLADPEQDDSSVLENLVFLELKRRGYIVHTGIINGMEVDFVAQKDKSRLYIQVASSVEDEEIFQKAVRPFRSIPDFYPRVLITLDEQTQDIDGIRHLNAIDFLSGAPLN